MKKTKQFFLTFYQPRVFLKSENAINVKKNLNQYSRNIFIDEDNLNINALETDIKIQLNQLFEGISISNHIKQYFNSLLEKIIVQLEKDEIKEKTKVVDQSKKELKTTIQSPTQKIALTVGHKTLFPNINDSIYFEADGNHSKCFFINEERDIYCSMSLSIIEEKLISVPHIFRVHKKYLINILRVKEYNRSGGGYLIMENDYKIPVSRFKRFEFDNLLKQIMF